jgi:BirA family biotin operon repressor/biotin-[acetyl-CoA-carboxylase] ligase
VTSTNDLVSQNLTDVTKDTGLVVIADEQTNGRGRLDRSWSTPAGSGIAMTVGVHTATYPYELSVVPLISGVAVIRALRSFDIPVELKWPNDIVFTKNADPKPSVRKLGGILVQLIQDKLIIGIGLNVDLTTDELPVPTATSLLIEGFVVSREKLIIQILEELTNLKIENEEWLVEYTAACSTLGRNIRVLNSNGTEIIGEAISISESGALMVKNLENIYYVTVGDIEHLAVD